MHVRLAPGERLLPGTEAALASAFEDPLVEGVLLRLEPDGEGRLARSARGYMAAWDRRFLHRMNWFAPASRVVTRTQVPGHRVAEAAPFLARAIAKGHRVEALSVGGVASPIAHDLGAWVRWAREEGAAWGALAAREPPFAGVLPARSTWGWLDHNVWHVSRRWGEVLEATRVWDPVALLLHQLREAAWSGAAVRALRLG